MVSNASFNMTSNDRRLASLTGNRNDMDTLITSSANSLYLIFTSNYIYQYRGFAANYMAVSLSFILWRSLLLVEETRVPGENY
jgi:hypothetical protein